MKEFKETTFKLKKENNIQIIMPSGDLNNSSADKLRILLIELYDRGDKNFCFDFKHVKDIDSLSLSLFFIFGNMTGKNKSKSTKIINAGKDPGLLFQMTGLNSFFNIYKYNIREKTLGED